MQSTRSTTREIPTHQTDKLPPDVFPWEDTVTGASKNNGDGKASVHWLLRIVRLIAFVAILLPVDMCACVLIFYVLRYFTYILIFLIPIAMYWDGRAGLNFIFRFDDRSLYGCTVKRLLFQSLIFCVGMLPLIYFVLKISLRDQSDLPDWISWLPSWTDSTANLLLSETNRIWNEIGIALACGCVAAVPLRTLRRVFPKLSSELL